MVEIKGTHGVVGTSLTLGKQNQFKWQEVVKRKRL